MKYFNKFPLIAITDKKGNSQVYTNILSRLSIIPSVLKNPLVFYPYNIQDGDTPEIVAHKYYGDINRFWIVMYSNNILDPQWDWPLSINSFNSYVNDKYENPYALHSYEKVITTTNLVDNSRVSNTYTISEEEYDSLIENSKVMEFSTGTVLYELTKNEVTFLEYENRLNEAKRNIKLLNSNYASQLEQEFETLMG
jgi:hypothetical protein